MRAERINRRISQILTDALCGTEDRYVVHSADGGKYVRWGLVERELHLSVIAELSGVNHG